MHILAIRTPLLTPGTDLAAHLRMQGDARRGDIVVVSSKAVATCEGTIHDLREMEPSAEAHRWSERCGKHPAFCELVLHETRRMHGHVRGTAPGALLTELSPEAMTGTMLIANAGVDESNAPEGRAVGWPLDPVRSARTLREAVGGVAIVISDSVCVPRRLGVLAMALAASGIDPHRSLIGTQDLFGKSMRITREAVADQLAVAANLVMGNADESAPAAIIREHGIPFSSFEGWVPGIAPADDLFTGLLGN